MVIRPAQAPEIDRNGHDRHPECVKSLMQPLPQDGGVRTAFKREELDDHVSHVQSARCRA